jgi:hypothetical protein
MSPPSPSPTPYQVIPSGRVSTEAKALAKRAAAAGFHQQVVAALKRIHHILSIYPQLGEPLRDLATTGETECTLNETN